MTKLDEFLTEKKIDNDAFAKRLQKRGLRCTTSWIRQIRGGHAEPGKRLAFEIERLTKGAVSFADLVRGAA